MSAVDIPDTVTAISQHAFANCSSLQSVNLPSKLVSIGAYSFQNCDALTSIYIPKSLTTIDGYYGPFYGCDNLNSIVFEEGTTKIAPYLFYYCTGLRSIEIPNTVTSIGAYAFNACSNLESVVIPDAVTTIGSNAFRNCSNVVISCSANSYALEYAIQNNLLVNVTDWAQTESDILVMENSYYNTNSSDVNASGYADLVVHYELQEEQIGKLSDMKLRILLQGKLVLLENSVRLDGSVPVGYTYQDNILTVPVTSSIGVLRFSVNPESEARLFSRAELTYKANGTSGSEIIGCINSDMPVLTLVTSATVNCDHIEVSGIAPAQGIVSFYIDDEAAGTATASKAGHYSATLTLPDPDDGDSFTVKATVTTETGTVEKEVSVTYDLSAPVLEELLMYYSNQVIDLTDPQKTRTVITFGPNNSYTYRVKMTNPEMISRLYVTSTRNGQPKYIEAVYNEKTGYFVTSDRFDPKVWNYVPGEIGIAFDLSYDWIDSTDTDAITTEMVEEMAAQKDYGGSTADVVENSDHNLGINVTMPDGAELNYEYHEFTVDEMYQYLLDLGFTPPAAKSRSRQSDAEVTFKLIEDLVKTYLKEYEQEVVKYYLGETDDGNLIAVCLNKTFSEEGDRICQAWCIKQLKKIYDPDQSLVDYVLDPDSLFFETTKEFKDFSGSVYSAVYSSGKATISYLGRIWELDLQKMGASEAERQQIEATQELLTVVLLGRYIVSLAALSFTIACPAAAGLIGLGAYLMNDLLDSLEQEESWVTGFDNSIIGRIILGLDSAFQWFLNNFLKWIIDPSGYVYEAVTSNRLSGVTATVYYQDPETGKAVLWDAGEYDQINPIITRGDGIYAWDVPEGLWQVRYELDGYDTVTTDWMEVPPPQTDVNVGLVSYTAPEAEWIEVYHDSVEIEFDKYMIPDTVDAITLKDGSGTPIDYTLHYSSAETDPDGTVYARAYTLEFNSALLDNGELCTITIPGTVKSYSGIGVTSGSVTAPCSEQILITSKDTVTVFYGSSTQFQVDLSVDSVAKIKAVSLFNELAHVDSVNKIDADSWIVTVSGILPGATVIQISVPGTNVSKQVATVVERMESTHTHAYETAATNPSCTEQGYTTYTCHCGDSYVADYVEVIDHTYKNGTCSVCGHTTIAAPIAKGSNKTLTGKPVVTWEPVEGAVKYEVYRSTKKNSTYTRGTSTTGTTYTNTKAVAGKYYYYFVRAIDADGNYADSNIIGRTCDLAQTTVTLSNVASTGKIKISWEVVEGATKYEVYRATSKTGTYSRISTTSNTSVTNTKAEAGKTYYYKVRAICDIDAAAGAYSAVKSRTCDLAQTTVTLSNVASTGKIKVSWTAVEGATKYEVYRTTSKNGTYSRISTTSNTSVTNTKADAGKTYYYKVRAICDVDAAAAAYSAVKSRTCDLPQPDVSIALSSKKPKVGWDKVDGAVSYKVYRATSKTGIYSLVKTTTSMSYRDTKATTGKTYYYKVVAVCSNTAGNSAYSGIVSIKSK